MTVRDASCPSAEDMQLAALGCLPAAESEMVAEHLLVCERCVTAFGSIEAEDSFIEAMRQQPAVLAQWAQECGDVEGLIAQVHSRVSRAQEQTWDSAAPSEATPSPGEKQAKDEWPTNPGVFAPGQTPSDKQPNEGASAGYAFLAAPEAPDEIGRLGEYRVLRVLGSGGMGVVFEAEDLRLHRRVAMKVMKPSAAGVASARKRFLRVNGDRKMQRLAGSRRSAEKCSAHDLPRGFVTKTWDDKSVTSGTSLEEHECTEICICGLKSVAWC